MTKNFLAVKGEILRINLSEKSASVERKDDNFYRKYLGGSVL